MKNFEHTHFGFAEQISRIRFLVFVFVLLALIGIARLFYLMIIKNDFYAEAALGQHWARDVIQPKRGKIYVKDEITGELYPIADNQKMSLISAAPEEIENKKEAASRIGPILNIKEEKIINLLENNHTYVVLAKAVSYEIAEKIKSFNIKGVNISDQYVRYYPEGSLAAHVLGFVNADGQGNYGLEQYFNPELYGKPGTYKAEIDPTGKKIAFGKTVLKEAENGTDIVLTINRDVQKKAEQILSSQVKRFSAEGGSMIVMDPESGEILAMANVPTFDPNKYSSVQNFEIFKNSAAQGLYEPGSIFKVMTMAAGLDSGKIEPETEYKDTGKIILDGHKIQNSDRKAHGLVTMTQVLEKSLNTGTTFVMQQVGKLPFYEYLKKFGFGKKTGIEQPIEESGVIYKPSEVNDHTYATISFGQSITTTPIQMISSFAMVANGGKLIRPHLVAETILEDGRSLKTDKRPITEVISKETTAKLKKMMVAVVENGHGKQAAVSGYTVAGKTGTAQVPKKDGLGYDPYRNIGSFVGFGPAESPRFVVLAKIDSPKGVPWAETTAAPIVGQMLDFLFKYYQIPPSS